MTRFSSSNLDLSRINRATLWPERSFEDVVQRRIADFKARLDAAGFDFDVESLESDPGIVLLQSGAYRELVKSYEIDDAQAAVLLAFATGNFLDKLGDLHATPRQEGETDDRYRARIQLAPEAFSNAGTLGGYLYHAVSASPLVKDVGISVVNKGTNDVGVELVILSSVGNGEPSDDLMQIVRARLLQDDVRLTTDNLIVRPARVVTFDVSASLRIRPGPDPLTIRNNALAALQRMAARYKRVGGDIPASAVSAALYTDGVDRVDMQAPAADVTTLRFQAPHLRNITLKTVVSDD